MTKTTKTPELTVTQTMLRIGKSQKTIWNMIHDGRLTARLVPAPVPYYLVSLESIEAYEQQQKERDQAAT